MDKNKSENQFFPPVVAVLGHVDHGKTTLLDTFRKTSIAQKEHGGITQKIGASTVEVKHEDSIRRITFIDTPGHEAFSEMRGRGAAAADIGLLVVSAVDGVKPQTKESISLLKASKVPYIVVLTKVDSEQKNTEKVKQEISKEGVMIEGYGGDVPVIEVSAKTGQNIKELLELILLVWDLHPLSGVSSQNSLNAIVIESKQDPKAGAKATIVIKNGTISVRDDITTGEVSGRVRGLLSDSEKQLKSATVGEAVEILGFENAPSVGNVVYKGSETQEVENEPTMTQARNEEGVISLVLVTDTLGSLEAIIGSLPMEKINIISRKTGEITTADILLAKSVGALVLGFNIKIKPDIAKLASTEKVLAKNYTIIYEMLSEITDAVEGKELSMMEEVYGTAQILASFPFDKQTVMGVKVLEGRVAKGDKVRIERGDEVIGEGHANSVRQGKEQTSRVEAGQEAGIIVGPSLDFLPGDMVICHS